MSESALAPTVCRIINTSLKRGEVPTSYKHSHISPLYKSGDKSAARNYRPVSLLPILSRILEHFVKQQLSDYLNVNQLIPATQFAYRKHHSTEDALVLATNRWLMAKSERKHTGLVMIDMSKGRRAFDICQVHKRRTTRQCPWATTLCVVHPPPFINHTTRHHESRICG